MTNPNQITNDRIAALRERVRILRNAGYKYAQDTPLSLLEVLLQDWRPRGACGMRNHSDDCDCDGAGGDR